MFRGLKTIQRRDWFCYGGTAVALLLLLGFALFRLVPGAVWITDNGNKYILMRNLAAHGTREIQHPMPELFPRGGFHFQVVKAKIYSFYPDFLPALTVPFFKLCGERGVGVIPFLCTAILLLIFARNWGRRAPPWVLLLGTPFAFYAVLLWEMTPSVLAAVAAFGLLRRQKMFASGLVLGLGIWMREELYVLAAIIFLTNPKQCNWRFLLGLAAAVLPLWAVNWWQSGHILGLHGAMYQLNNRTGFDWGEELGGVFWNYWHNLLRFDVFPRTYWIFLLPPLSLIVAGSFPHFNAVAKFKKWALFFFLASEAILMVGLWCHPRPAYAAATTVGLIPALPWCAGFFLNWRPLWSSKNSAVRWGSRVIMGCVVLIPILLTRKDIGLIWGPRHFLMIVPLLWLLSCRAWSLSKLPRWSWGVAVALAVGLQFFSLAALDKVSRQSRQAEQVLLHTAPQVVVTDVFFLPEQTPRLFFAKTVLQVTTPGELQTLAASQVDNFTLVLSPHFRRLANGTLQQLMQTFVLQHQVRELPDNQAGFLDLLIVDCRRKK